MASERQRGSVWFTGDVFFLTQLSLLAFLRVPVSNFKSFCFTSFYTGYKWKACLILGTFFQNKAGVIWVSWFVLVHVQYCSLDTWTNLVMLLAAQRFHPLI